MNKFKLRDAAVIAVIAAAALCLFFIFSLRRGESGGEVTVTVNGSLYGTYALDEPQEVEIVQDGVVTNVLRIENGQANMESASCPDLICVHQGAVSHVHETIICLPNKVVVEVVTGENDFDAVAQ